MCLEVHQNKVQIGRTNDEKHAAEVRAEKAQGEKKFREGTNDGVPQKKSRGPSTGDLFDMFSKVGFKATKYPHVPTMQALCIYEDCQAIFKDMGVKRLIGVYEDFPLSLGAHLSIPCILATDI